MTQGSTVRKVKVANPSDLTDATSRDLLDRLLVVERRNGLILLELLNMLSSTGDDKGFELADFDDDYANDLPD